jgi:hypothetical protein
VQVLLVLAEVEDRISDELARPVVGDVAAALDLEDLDAASAQGFGVEGEARLASAAAEGDDGGVFAEEEEVVGQLTG